MKAAMMIVDVAKFFIEKGSQIMELVDAFVQSVSAIASGSVGKVAEMIERALSLSVPLLIGMFTSLLGLGDLAAKVTKIFKNIKGRVTGAVDGFIEKAGTWFKDKKGRRKERKEKKDKEKGAKNKKGEGADSDKDKKDKDSKKDKDHPSKLETDKRTDKQQQKDLKQGMKQGASVVNNEDLNKNQIKVQLNKLELQYRLDDLGAKLTQETAEWHTFMLSARLDGKHKNEEIKRKPTKAENEEQVSEEDRKFHQEILNEITVFLEKKGKSAENIETFQEFYLLLKNEVDTLQDLYQSKLRNGIKIDIDLINDILQDKADEDVDIEIHIYPNAKKKRINLPYPLSDVTNWSPKSGKTFGHTFLTHGQKERKNIEGRLESGNEEQGCWQNNIAAAAHIETLKTKIDNMPISSDQDFTIPSGLGVVLYKNEVTGKIIEHPALEMKVIRGSKKARAFIKTAFPIK